MLLPSTYLAYSLYTEQQIKKNIDLFIEKEFTDKGNTIIYKNITASGKKKIELAFLTKNFSKTEIEQLKSKLNQGKYLNDVDLVIRQDTVSNYNSLKQQITKITDKENQISAKDLKIIQLEKELKQNSFDNSTLLKEACIIFPSMQGISVSNHSFVRINDTVTFTAVIYEAPIDLNASDKEKLKNWLKQRLSKNEIYIFKKET